MVGLEAYPRLVLARRPVGRLELDLPSGCQGPRDPRTGLTRLIREDALQQAG